MSRGVNFGKEVTPGYRGRLTVNTAYHGPRRLHAFVGAILCGTPSLPRAACRGIYVIRTSTTRKTLDSTEVVTSYKNLKYAERDFRIIKSDDLDLQTPPNAPPAGSHCAATKTYSNTSSPWIAKSSISMGSESKNLLPLHPSNAAPSNYSAPPCPRP
jgi:hypothetical protein